jgi:hypothetical protein
LASVIRVFIGYDPRESVAYHTCVQSILEHTNSQVSFHPVCGERRDGSNDFIYARFLVPWLSGFSGTSIFLDGDMIVRGDIADLYALKRLDQGVQVVQHDYKTKHPVKYLGNKNEDYPRKNWSSVMVWNCGYFPNRKLTPEFVASKSGSYLHRFLWLNDGQIGALPDAWNRLVLEQEIQPEDKLLHYTVGTPCFTDYADCDGAEEWHATYAKMIAPKG